MNQLGVMNPVLADRGVHYACADYRALLESHGIRPSMSRKGNCWHNAVAESFFSSFAFEASNGEQIIAPPVPVTTSSARVHFHVGKASVQPGLSYTRGFDGLALHGPMNITKQTNAVATVTTAITIPVLF